MKYISLSIKKAFTLIELMVVIAIVAILATIAIPSYNSYTTRAALTELIQVSAPYKTEVEICIYSTGDKNNCNAGSNGIQSQIDNTSSNSDSYIKNINVSSGVITVNGKGALDGFSYSLNPTKTNNSINWEVNCNGKAGEFPSGFCTK